MFNLCVSLGIKYSFKDEGRVARAKVIYRVAFSVLKMYLQVECLNKLRAVLYILVITDLLVLRLMSYLLSLPYCNCV